MSLNLAAHGIAEQLIARAAALGVEVAVTAGVRVVDCGVRAPGSVEAGLLMVRAAMADRGEAVLLPTGDPGGLAPDWPSCPWPVVMESSAAPVAACLASQCAGWQVKDSGFEALASGPVRAAIGREKIFDVIGMRERTPVAVGLLEASRLPSEGACLRLASEAGVRPEGLVLLVARTASPACLVQVTARALETALHKLHTLGFDLRRVRAGRGSAPLPPVPPGDDLRAMGRANDAILYGSHVTLEVTGPDADLTAIGPRIVSLASSEHGALFLDLFERADRNFYGLDPALFAPARIDLVGLDSGCTHQFGRIEPTLVDRSFGG